MLSQNQRNTYFLFPPTSIDQKIRIFLGCAFFLIVAFLLIIRLSEPIEFTLQKDSDQYNQTAIHLATDHFYSLDGLQAYDEREPGYSFFLAGIYSVFGLSNRMAVFVVQAFLFFVLALVAVRAVDKELSIRIGTIFFGFLLLYPSVFHSIFSFYRESFLLSLFLLLFSLILFHLRSPSFMYSALMSIVLGLIALTNYAFFLLPFFLAGFLWFQPINKKYLLLIILIPAIFLGSWSMRNFIQTGYFRVIGEQRQSVMWYAKSEQAQYVKGFEPFLCLWSEYISRDWSGRSPACSTAGLRHRILPPIEAAEANIFNAELTHQSQQTILAHLQNYVWFSMVDIIELHLPFVNGWGRLYNLLVSGATVILFVGWGFLLRRSWQRIHILCVVFIAYTILIYGITDAMPRFLMPVIFAYMLLSSIGYASVFKKLSSNSSC